MHIFFTGNTEEAFLDSHPWLDSDCEDYFSVNGGQIKFVAGIFYFKWSFFFFLDPHPLLINILKIKLSSCVF